MTESKESKIREAQENELTIKAAKLLERKNRMIQEMRAAHTFKRLFILIKYKWFDMVFAFFTFVAVGTIAGIAARIIWEAWKVIFSVNH